MKHLKWLLSIILFFNISCSISAQNCHPEDSIAIYDLRDGLGLQNSYTGHIATWNIGSDIDTITDPANAAQFRITNIFFDKKVLGSGLVTLRDSLFAGDRLTMVQNLVIDSNFISMVETGGMNDGTGPTKSLKQIDISHNDIPTYPNFFTDLMDNMDSLEVFKAATALIGPSTALPTLSPKSFLHHLDISNNNFSGTLELDQIGNNSMYPSLSFLYVDDNPFTTLQVPSAAANFASNFQKLSIQGTMLQDFKPFEDLLNTIPSIKWLYAHNAMDTVGYQDSIEFAITSNLPNLIHLDISNNLLVGQVPIDLFEKLDNIEILYVNNNYLTGNLPTPISVLNGGNGAFVNQQAYGGTHFLRELDLSNNLLGGKLRLDWILSGMVFDHPSNNGSDFPLEALFVQENRFNEIRPKLENPNLAQTLNGIFNQRFINLRAIDVSDNALDFKDLFRLRRIFRFAHNGTDYSPISGTPTDFQYDNQAEVGIGGVRRQRKGKTITIQAGSGIVAPENGAPTNYISNNYMWQRIDTSMIAGGTAAVPYIETIAIASQIGGGTAPNPNFNNTGVATTIPTYVVGVNQSATDPNDLHKIAINSLDTLDHGDWLYRAVITNDSFPNLTIFSARKKVEVGGCQDDSGAEVWCQSMIIQFHPDTLANYPVEKHDSLKRAIRESIGAVPIEACLCGDIELWGVSDTATAMLEAFGKGTRNTATSISARPSLLSADPNYNLLAGNSSTLPDTVNLPAGSGNTTATTLVAIIDSGIDYEYSALTPYLSEGPSMDTCMQNAVWGFNFVDENNNATDDHGHGTAVAGIVAGISQQSILPDTGQADIAILPLKYTNKDGKGSLFNAACAIRYAADYRRMTSAGSEAKVRVINASWGYYGDPCIVLENVIEYAAEECDILFVAAAGNEGSIVEGADSLRHWPSNSIWDTTNSVFHDHVLSVAGTSNDPDTLDHDSNWGSVHIDIAAPWHEVAPQAGSTNGFASVEGTSFAAPQVSRAAALLFAKYPDAKYWAVKYALMNGVDVLQSPDSLLIRSKGRINYHKADSILNIITNKTVCTPSVNVNVDQIVDLDAFINIYPNPVDNQLTIDMDFDLSAEDLSISLFNLQGQLLQHHILAVGTTNTSLNTSNLPAGVYFVRVQLDDKQYSTKVIKN